MSGVCARVVAPSGHAQWNDLAASADGGTVYHDARWLETVSDAAGDELVLLGFYKHERLVAALPFQVRERLGLRLARRAFATPYSGLLHAPGISAETQAAVAEAFQSAAIEYSQFSVTSSPFSSHPEMPSGWQSKDRATWVLRLDGIEAMKNTLSPALQKKIRRTLRRGMAVTTDCPPDVFYDLYMATFVRRGLRPPFSRSNFCRMMTRLAQAGIGRAYLASAGGRPCAARLVLTDRRRAYCALSGFDPALGHLRAADCLMWEVMRALASTHTELDLVGANLSGISDFKAKFGGALMPYAEATRCRSRAEALLIRAHQWATRRRRGSSRD